VTEYFVTCTSINGVTWPNVNCAVHMKLFYIKLLVQRWVTIIYVL